MRTFLVRHGAPRLLAALLVAGLLLSSAGPVAADRWYAETPVLGIIDAGRQAPAASRAGASWDRALFLWQQIQPNSANDWTLDAWVDSARLKPTLSDSIPLVGVVQGTPQWAAGDVRDGASAVPTGLDLPVNDPRNTFGQFMLRLAKAYKGRITTWVIWNEPDFLPGESGSWWTWSGNTADFAALMRTGYRAVKQVDPNATVVFPATTYFADAVHGRELFLGRVLKEYASDKEAAANGYYFDAVGVNLYCSLDAVYRVHGYYASILSGFKLTKPLWLTEVNCPVYNDATTPVPPTGRITTDEQSGFLLQAVALARAAGYARIGWYSMVDHDASSGIFDRWGLLRADGSARPAYQAFRVASTYLAQPELHARLAPVGTQTADGWPVTRIVLDNLGEHERVQILWRTADGPASVRVDAAGTSAHLVDPFGFSATAPRVDNTWEVALPPPRTPQASDPPGFQSVGYPVVLVESGIPGVALTDPPRITSPQMALAAGVVAAAPAPEALLRPPSAAPPVATAAAAPAATAAVPVAAIQAPITQPGPSLVLTISNPQPNDLVQKGRVVMQGLAFDRAAAAGSGVDRVSIFVDNRDSGGQHVGDATLGQPGPTGFTAVADLSRFSGGHTLYLYARSTVTGKETVVSFPIAIGNR
jgi:hypothetical protein